MFGHNTNKTNLKIARETNETNKEIMEMQLAANERLWNMSNEYNTMAAQRKRMTEAGYNPAALLGNTSEVGPAESFDAIPAQRAEMKNYEMENAMAAASNLNQAALTAAQIKKTDAEAENIQIQNAYQGALLGSQVGMNTSQMFNTEADTTLKKYQTVNTNMDTIQKELQYTFDSLPEVFNYRIAEAHQKSLLTQYNADLAKLQGEYQSIENDIKTKYGPEKAQKEIESIQAEINSMSEQAKYWKEMGKTQTWVRQHLESEMQYYESLSRYYNEQTTRETLMNGIIANTFDDRIAEERMQGQRARLQYFFDQQHYLDFLYNQLKESNYSVEKAEYLTRQAKYAADMARQANDWYAVEKFMSVANSAASIYTKGANVQQGKQALDMKMQELNSVTESDYTTNTDYYNSKGQKTHSVRQQKKTSRGRKWYQ